jgi:hypothetical protein
MRLNSIPSPLFPVSQYLAISLSVLALFVANRSLAGETTSRSLVRIKTETDVVYGEHSELGPPATNLMIAFMPEN